MNDQAIQAIGIVAGICTAVSLIPQVVKIIKEKKSGDISFAYLFILLAGQILWITYGSLRQDPPIVATNAVSVTVNLLTIGFGLKYKKG